MIDIAKHDGRHSPQDAWAIRLHASLRSAAARGEEDLADEIMDCGGEGDLELQLFLDAVPDLVRMPIALDAAIEVVLRSMLARGIAPAEACEVLASNYPHLAPAIRRAHELAEVMRGTKSLADAFRQPRRVALPCSVGPPLADGRPRYRLHELVGAGSQGSVYLAQDLAFTDPAKPAWVAAKIVAHGEHVSDFLAEAHRARRVAHEFVVRVLDCFQDPDGEAWIVTEYVRGGALESWVEGCASRSSPRESARLAVSIARGVQAVHSTGVLHRDLKPSNILMTEAGVPKIGDFGIATGQVRCAPDRLGSLAFAAPEQFDSRTGEVTVAADVYAVGGILLWLLTGCYPNRAACDGFRSPARAPDPHHRRNRPARQRIDADLKAIIDRALAPIPSGRYGSADALANDLEAWLRGDVLAWRKPGIIRRARLATKRSPRSAAVVFGSLGVGLAATMFAGHSIGRAEAARAAAALQQAEVQIADQQNRARLGDNAVRLLSNYLRLGTSNSLPDNWIPALTFVEALLGPAYTEHDNAGTPVWESRIRATRAELEYERAAGRGDHHLNLVKEHALCLWLIRSGEHREAAARLASLATRIEGLLNNATDPWLIELGVLTECARALEALESTSTAAAAREHLNQARLSADRLPRSPTYVNGLLRFVDSRLQ